MLNKNISDGYSSYWKHKRKKGKKATNKKVRKTIKKNIRGEQV